jgi:hypothetical protein
VVRVAVLVVRRKDFFNEYLALDSRHGRFCSRRRYQLVR